MAPKPNEPGPAQDDAESSARDFGELAAKLADKLVDQLVEELVDDMLEPESEPPADLIPMDRVLASYREHMRVEREKRLLDPEGYDRAEAARGAALQAEWKKVLDSTLDIRDILRDRERKGEK